MLPGAGLLQAQRAGLPFRPLPNGLGCAAYMHWRHALAKASSPARLCRLSKPPGVWGPNRAFCQSHHVAIFRLLPRRLFALVHHRRWRARDQHSERGASTADSEHVCPPAGMARCKKFSHTCDRIGSWLFVPATNDAAATSCDSCLLAAPDNYLAALGRLHKGTTVMHPWLHWSACIMGFICNSAFD